MFFRLVVWEMLCSIVFVNVFVVIMFNSEMWFRVMVVCLVLVERMKMLLLFSGV